MDDSIRARIRSWTRLLATAAGVDPATRRKRSLSRSPLRAAMRAAVQARLGAGGRRELTEAVRALFFETADAAPAGDPEFTAYVAELVGAARRLEAGTADPVAVWDVVLTGIELRPSLLGATDSLGPARLFRRR